MTAADVTPAQPITWAEAAEMAREYAEAMDARRTALAEREGRPDDCTHSDLLKVMADTGRRKCYDCGEEINPRPAVGGITRGVQFVMVGEWKGEPFNGEVILPQAQPDVAPAPTTVTEQLEAALGPKPWHSDPGEPCEHPFCVAKRADQDAIQGIVGLVPAKVGGVHPLANLHALHAKLDVAPAPDEVTPAVEQVTRADMDSARRIADGDSWSADGSVAPAPDGNAGGVDVYREATQRAFDALGLTAADVEPMSVESFIEWWAHGPGDPLGFGAPPSWGRALIDAGRAPLLAEVERLRARIHEAVDETQRRYAAYQARCNRFDAIVKWAREQLGVEVGNPRFWNSINSATQHALLALTEERDDARADLAEATRERAEARAKAVDGTPLGYVVFMREHGHWSENWDGEVHVTRDEGLAASADARAAGYEAVLTAAIAVEPVTDDGSAG